AARHRSRAGAGGEGPRAGEGRPLSTRTGTTPGGAGPLPAPRVPAAPAVLCAGLVKRYDQVVAVNGLDLEVRAGECFGLLGPNGAGKTTTIEMIQGLLTPDQGTVELFGLGWQGHEGELRQRMGTQLQETK